MTENPEVPSSPSPAPACRRSWLVVVVLLIIGATLAVAYALRVESPLLGTLIPHAPTSADLDPLEQRLATLEAMLKETERSVAPIPTPQPALAPIDLAPINEAIKELGNRLAQLEARNLGDQQSVRRFVSEAFAFWELREAARSGNAFERQLATLREHSAKDSALDALSATLEPYAATGVPTLNQLRQSLAFVEDETPLPTRADAQVSVWEKIKAMFQPLIAVRPEQDPRFSALEAALTAGQAADALDAVKALPPEAQAPIAPWRAKLESRIAVDASLKALSAYFLEPPQTEATP